MSEQAENILKNIFISYNKGEEYYKIKAPVSSQIHSFNMAVNEIKDYIEFIERNMITIKISLTDKGLEYCIAHFDF